MLHKIVYFVLSRTFVGSVLRRIRPVPVLYRRFVWSKRANMNDWSGVYATYDAALAAVPAELGGGWNDDTVAAGRQFQSSIYATIFWISKMLETGSRIVDFGGAVGQTYDEFVQRQPFPDGATWCVVDVPTAVKRGRELSAANKRPGLSFAEQISDVDGCDIFVSRGCLQYVATPLGEILDSLPALPRYLLIDKIPLTDGEGFCTLQHLGLSASPYKIFNRSAFLSPLAERGYVVRDAWPVQDINFAIPFHPEKFLPSLQGLVLERTGSH